MTDWNNTTPEERTMLLSPFECALLETYRDMERRMPEHFRVGLMAWDPTDDESALLAIESMVSGMLRERP